ncbi:MAG: hypothetical protein RBT66_09105 [bacterium]|jgi:hypothetical protein|nr:hypothetical protein [bacterium]
MNQTISISLSNPRRASASRDLLMLEQRGWRPYTGYVTAANAVAFLGRMLYGEETDNNWSERTDCGMTGEDMVTGIFAYPAYPDLAYQIAASYGILSEGVREEIEQEEVLQFSLEDEASTKYPSQGIISAEPLGDLYDAGGGIVPIPAISIEQDKVTLSRAVYGSIRITYRVLRDTYILTVTRRDPETTVENFYSSVAYAWYDGGGDWLTVEAPPGADEFDSECGWSSGLGSATWPDDEHNRPVSSGADRRIVIEYCSGVVWSDKTWETFES